MPYEQEKQDIIIEGKPWEPLTGPYADSAIRARRGQLEWQGEAGGAEAAPNGEQDSGRRIITSREVVSRPKRPQYCR